MGTNGRSLRSERVQSGDRNKSRAAIGARLTSELRSGPLFHVNAALQYRNNTTSCEARLDTRAPAQPQRQPVHLIFTHVAKKRFSWVPLPPSATLCLLSFHAWQDFTLIDHLAHFDRERIPERVVHAKGAGAFGYFEVRRAPPSRNLLSVQV